MKKEASPRYNKDVDESKTTQQNTRDLIVDISGSKVSKISSKLSKLTNNADELFGEVLDLKSVKKQESSDDLYSEDSAEEAPQLADRESAKMMSQKQRKERRALFGLGSSESLELPKSRYNANLDLSALEEEDLY